MHVPNPKREALKRVCARLGGAEHTTSHHQDPFPPSIYPTFQLEIAPLVEGIVLSLSSLQIPERIDKDTNSCRDT
jgi:hypothetical protein